MKSRHFGLLILIILFSGLAYAGEPQWIEVRSPHFSVVSDAGEKRAREVAVRFEQMRAVFGALLTKAKVNLPVPLQIVAFRNSKEMRQFVPLWHGKPTNDSGLFVGSDDRCFILLDLSAENAWHAVFHEYGHQLLHGNISAEVSTWFDEGFAEYFSTITVAGKEADIGKIPDDDFQVLQSAGWLHVADLLRIRQDTNVYNESGERRSAFYAQSWLLVHYLFDKRLIPQSAQYFELIYDKNVPVEDASRQAFGMSTAEWDKSLKHYFNGNRFLYMKIATPPDIETTGYTVAPLEAADWKSVLADLHAHSSDYADKAINEFEEVLKVKPDHPAALRGLGHVYLDKRDFARAGEYFDKAAKLDIHDPRVLYYSALLLNQEKTTSGQEDYEHIKNLLERSIALDPNFADSYSLLAFAYLYLGRNNDALTTMRKAVSINPSNQGYYLNLAHIYLANQNLEAATKVLTALKSSSNPQIAAEAGQELMRIEEYKVVSARAQVVTGPRQPEQALQVRETNTSTRDASEFNGPAPVPPPPSGPINFLKGKLVSVDCSAGPGATLTIKSAAKTWKMHTENGSKLVVIGDDKLNCSWSDRNVAVNYHPTGDSTGELMSLELQ